MKFLYRKRNGIYAWLVVIGASYLYGTIAAQSYGMGRLIHSCSAVFGMTDHVEYSRVISTNTLICNLALLYGYAVNKCNLRLIGLFGAILTVTGYFIALTLSNPWAFFFGFGVVTGVGSGISLVTAIEAVSLYSSRRWTAFSNGLLTCSTPIFGLIYPHLIEYLEAAWGPCDMPFSVLACIIAQHIAISFFMASPIDKEPINIKMEKIDEILDIPEVLDSPGYAVSKERLSRTIRQSLQLKIANNAILWSIFLAAPTWIATTILMFTYLDHALAANAVGGEITSATVLSIAQCVDLFARFFTTVCLALFHRSKAVLLIHASCHICLCLVFTLLPLIITHVHPLLAVCAYYAPYGVLLATLYNLIVQYLPPETSYRAAFFGIYNTFVASGGIIFYFFSYVLDLSRDVNLSFYITGFACLMLCIPLFLSAIVEQFSRRRLRSDLMNESVIHCQSE